MNLEEARQAGLSLDRSKRLSDGRKSRATTRKLDYRASDFYQPKIVEIYKDIFINRLPVTLIAKKHLISRKTVWRYKKLLWNKNKELLCLPPLKRTRIGHKFAHEVIRVYRRNSYSRLGVSKILKRTKHA